MALIETVNLQQKYDGQDVLKGINLKVERGEVFAVIGPTGAGKTTLLKLLDLLELPFSGSMYFDGVDVTSSRRERFRARRRMAIVQQKPIVFTMNVYDNVSCGLRWRHEKSGVIREKVEKALDMVRMADYKTRDARTLSGGETQLVAIARALVTEPEVMFLDEPTANLDPVSVVKIEEVLSHIIREQKTTILMATHDMSQGQRLAGRVGVMIGGEILQVGTPGEIFTSPGSREVAEFVGIENILSGVVVEKDDSLVSIQVDGATIQAVARYVLGDRVDVLIRPENITFTLSERVSSARNVFKGIISKLTLLEPLVRIEVDCGFPLLGVLTKKSAQELNLTVGNEVYASFKATAIHVIRRWD